MFSLKDINRINLEAYIKTRYLDIFSVVLIIIMNPILYFITLSPGVFPPDIFAYATMAKNFFHDGLLYLPSWGHVDNGLILPPLYPFLMAVGRFVSSETIIIAEYISSICMLLFAVPAFLFIKQKAGRLTAVIAIIVIQINYHFFLLGMRPLTESLFLLTIVLMLWLSLLFFRSCNEKQRLLPLLLGISCSLVFFTRQIGAVVYIFAGFLFLLQWFLNSGQNCKKLLNNFLLFVLGSMVLLLPYSTVLYLQTDQHPLKQNFRENEYVIKVDDSKIIEKIEQAKDLPDNLVKLIEDQPDQEYGIVYAQRRRMRELLPDASEMYSNVYVEGKAKSGNIKKAFLNLLNPKAYFKRIWNNILNLQVSLGSFGTILFFLLCFTPLFIKTDEKRNLERFLLPSFVIIYLLAISLLTDKIARYVYILFPFCLMHISIEMYIMFNRLKGSPKYRLPAFLMISFIFVAVLASTPGFFTDLKLGQKYWGIDNEYGHDFKKIVNGEPVFSLSPSEAYIIGSPYRILPNDTLEKVAAYGKKTGVRWILLFHNASSISELQMCGNLKWYTNRALGKTYPDLVKFRLGREDGSLMLYEIL